MKNYKIERLKYMSKKTIVVVGAGQGLGNHVAEKFAKENFRVVLVARRSEALAEYQKEFATKGIEVGTVACDATDAESVKAAFEKIHAEVGTPDVLVYNVGITTPDAQPLDEQEVLRQLRILIHRCDGLAGESFSPLRDAQFEGSTTSVHSEEFMGVMLRVIPYMKQYPEGSLSVSDICRACNLNYVGFLELFSKNIAKKSHELARRLRLQQGAVMLRQSDKLIEDVAEECGFSTPNYFAVCFRRMYKVSPSEYRQHLTPITQHPSPSTHKV